MLCQAACVLRFCVEGRVLWQPEPKLQPAPACVSCIRAEENGRLWRQGANSGTFAIRVNHYAEIMRRWEAVDQPPPVSPKVCFDQAAWNRVLFDMPAERTSFERDEIQFPLLFHHSYLEWRGAALIHANGCRDARIKTEFPMAQYLGRFLGEPPDPLLSMLLP